jgi:hypothetical protein
MRRALAVMTGTVVVSLCPFAPAASAGSTTVLDQTSFWRWRTALRKPAIIGGSGAGVLPVRVTYRSYPGLEHLETPPPPAGWTAPDYDDADWPRAPIAGTAALDTALFSSGVEFCVGLLTLRGKFAVADPAAVQDLQLALTYRGGVVVHVNAKEIARQDLPDGTITASSPGHPYPADSFLDARAPRDRRLGPVAIPRDALRRGVNVLAIEIHRSDYPQAATRWFGGPSDARGTWVPLGLGEVRLTAAAGVTPNVGRPAGLQVWNHNINDRVTARDYGDPNEPLRPIRVVGARNGVFSGEVVVGASTAIQGLSATAGDLTSSAGGVIPAAQVRVRYPRLDHGQRDLQWFDALDDEPPARAPAAAGGAVQPIYVTVRIPRDVPAGDYRGTLTVTADGRNVPVPITVRVADWTLPDPQAFRTYVGIYQSPTTLALRYNVPEWSEKHWALMERSFDLLGQVGNKIVNIPLSEQTQFGNDEGMVYWIRKPDGTFDYDFTVFDRYLTMVKKHLGVPDFVALQVWHSGGWETRQADQQNTVTVLDPKTGKHERLQVPVFGTEASKAFWKPVLDAVRKRLAAEGMEQAMCLGILSDGTAPPQVFRAFDEIFPGGAKWTRGCHSPTRETAPYTLGRGVASKVVLHEHCYGMSMADPSRGLPPIWKQRSWVAASYIRHSFDDWLSLLKYRTMAERGLYCGTRGIGRVCLDFWDVLPPSRAETRNIYNRYPFSSCAQRSPNLWRLAAPGPDGAVATVRFENLREGVEDAEATIVIAEAAVERAAQLGPELAATCRQLYIDRINYARRTCPETWGRVYIRSCHDTWQDLSERTYTAAAEVTKKLGGR